MMLSEEIYNLRCWIYETRKQFGGDLIMNEARADDFMNVLADLEGQARWLEGCVSYDPQDYPDSHRDDMTNVVILTPRIPKNQGDVA